MEIKLLSNVYCVCVCEWGQLIPQTYAGQFDAFAEIRGIHRNVQKNNHKWDRRQANEQWQTEEYEHHSRHQDSQLDKNLNQFPE